jgi:hypothetical protein
MLGFLLRAVYGTLVTPSIAFKWTEEEDGMCKLCWIEVGSAQHILSACRVALQQERYRWRHDKDLNQIQSQVARILKKRVNNPRRQIRKQRRELLFVKAGDKVKEKPKSDDWLGMGILSEAKDWILFTDLDGQLKFPPEVASTKLRPNLITYSTSIKRIVKWELTCPCEERTSTAFELELDRVSREWLVMFQYGCRGRCSGCCCRKPKEGCSHHCYKRPSSEEAGEGCGKGSMALF